MNSYNKTRLKKPWPTREAMTQVYQMKLWGGKSHDFYSGDGSHNPNIVNPYIQVVQSFLSSFKLPIRVLDLGCGDFNVGNKLLAFTQDYTGIDIVPELIDRNKELFQADNLLFQCLDIAKEEWPVADCVLIRQVLQHLSNAEVKHVTSKLADYKHIIVTEHIPNGSFKANTDIISGQGTRLKKQSGIDLLEAPFHFKPKESKELLSIDLGDKKGVIKTWLFTN